MTGYGIVPFVLLLNKVATRNARSFSFPKAFLSSKHSTFSFDSSKEDDDQLLPEALAVLAEAYKFRINQLRLRRIGMKPIEKECIREFELVDVLKNNQKLMFIRLHHAIRAEKYEMSAFKYSPEFGGSGEGPCLVEMKLERNPSLKTVAARIYSPPGRRIAYVYDLAGVYRTAIIEDGSSTRCLYQMRTDTPYCWTSDGKISSGKGRGSLGHFVKLKTDKEYRETRKEIKLYVKLHKEMNLKSKCILLGAALYLMSYDYVR